MSVCVSFFVSQLRWAACARVKLLSRVAAIGILMRKFSVSTVKAYRATACGGFDRVVGRLFCGARVPSALTDSFLDKSSEFFLAGDSELHWASASAPVDKVARPSLLCGRSAHSSYPLMKKSYNYSIAVAGSDTSFCLVFLRASKLLLRFLPSKAFSIDLAPCEVCCPCW